MLCEKGLKSLPTDTILDWTKLEAFADNKLTLSQTNLCFYMSSVQAFGKGENARYEQFLLFPQCLLPTLRTFCHFHQI